MAIGPDHQIALACVNTNAEIIDDNGNKVALLTGDGGGDEVWFNPGDGHYFFGIAGTGQLGVADAGPPPSVDATAPSAIGAHSVAADPFRNQVYVPISAHAPGSTVCSSTADVFGDKGNNALGCIAIYTSPNDDRGCIAEGMAVVATNDAGDPQFRRGRCHDHD
jgi:hypothetical protein